MATIKNAGQRRLGIASRPSIVLNAGETKEISAAQYQALFENRTVSRWIGSGVLVVGDVPDGANVQTLEVKKPEAEKNVEVDATLPEGVTGKGIEIHEVSKGWFQVYVNGFLVTDGKVRKSAAEEIAKEYE